MKAGQINGLGAQGASSGLEMWSWGPHTYKTVEIMGGMEDPPSPLKENMWNDKRIG